MDGRLYFGDFVLDTGSIREAFADDKRAQRKRFYECNIDRFCTTLPSGDKRECGSRNEQATVQDTFCYVDPTPIRFQRDRPSISLLSSV